MHAGSPGAEYSEQGSAREGCLETPPEPGSGLSSRCPTSVHLSTNLGSLQSPSTSAELLDSIQNLPEAAALFSHVLSGHHEAEGKLPQVRKPMAGVGVGALGRLLRRSCSAIESRSQQTITLSWPPTPPPIDLEAEGDTSDGNGRGSGDGSAPSAAPPLPSLPPPPPPPPPAHTAPLLLRAQCNRGTFAEEDEDHSVAEDASDKGQPPPLSLPLPAVARGAKPQMALLPQSRAGPGIPRRHMPWELPPAGPSAIMVRQGGAPSVAETRSRAFTAGIPASDFGGASLFGLTEVRWRVRSFCGPIFGAHMRADTASKPAENAGKKRGWAGGRLECITG
jgi:hypothetical protein